MYISYDWLKEIIDFPYSPEELGKILTAQGMTLDGLEHVGMSYDNVVVGRLEAVENHPDAEKLHVCKVNVGKETLQIVCGAPGIKAGDCAPVALVGADLGGMKIKPSKLRGVDSFGMCCGADELGVSADHTTLLFLPSDSVPGTPFGELLKGDDWIFDLDIPGNRPDLLSHIGVAREIAAHMALADPKYMGWQPKNPQYQECELKVGDKVSVSVEDKDLCPRYTARVVDNVKVGASPLWMQARLFRCGMRSINNVVDISNYVMLETGQPLHTFDYDKVGEANIVVRRAAEGEKFTTLDETERTLDHDTLMITDGKRGLAIGGVMGGLDSGVTEATKSILLESAYFYGPNIRRTSRKLALQSEASSRYERCIRGTCEYASKRAVELLTLYAGARAWSGVVDVNNETANPKLDISLKKCVDLLGMDIPLEKAVSILKALNYGLEPNGDRLTVTVPPYRVDVKVSADISEDLAKMLGYDSVPMDHHIPYYSQKPVAPLVKMRSRLRETFCGLGLREALNPTLVSPELISQSGCQVEPKDVIRLANSATADQSEVRTVLYPGLLKNVQLNVSRNQTSVALFEIGRAYLNAEDGRSFAELEKAAFVLYGERKSKTWSEKPEGFDFTDGRTILEGLQEKLGLPEIQAEAASLPGMHPGRTAALSVFYRGKKQDLGFLSELDPRVSRKLDLKGRVIICELDLKVLTETARGAYTYAKLPKYPSSQRDISLLAPKSLTNAAILEVIRKAGGKLMAKAEVFDFYRDDSMPEGTRSLTYRATYRALDRTLTVEEVEKAHAKVLEALGKTEVTIR